jgi:hypothetical protein
MAQAVSRRSLTPEARVSQWGICGGQSEISFPTSCSIPCQYHSTVALQTHVSSGGWTIGPLVAAVQRRIFTPWITHIVRDRYENVYSCLSAQRIVLISIKNNKSVALQLWRTLGRLSSRRWQSFRTAPDGTGLTCGQHIESHSCIFSFPNRTVTSLFK